jgi:hypothetical protein
MAQYDFLPPPDAEVPPPFRAPYAPPDEDIAAAFLQAAPFDAVAEARIDARAGALVAGLRTSCGNIRCPRGRASPSWCWQRRCCGCPTPPPRTG